MDGVTVVRQLLVSHSDLIGLVPALRIAAGPMPLGIALPAIAISSISSVDLNIPSPGASRFVTERVQVTVMAASYPEQKTILRKVRQAAADKRPTVTGLANVAVHSDGAGPDFVNEAASIWMGSQDFKATFSETR